MDDVELRAFLNGSRDGSFVDVEVWTGEILEKLVQMCGIEFDDDVHIAGHPYLSINERGH